MKELFRKHAYPCCLIWLLCVGFVTSINTYLDLNVNEYFLVFFILVSVILVRLFDMNKKNAIPYVIIAVLIILLSIILYSVDFSFHVEFEKYQSWLRSAIYEDTVSKIWYSILTCGLFSFIITIVFSILVKRFRIRITIAGLLLVGMILCTLIQISVSKIGICCFLTYFVLMFVETKLIYFYEKVNKTDAKPMPFLLPFFMIFFLALLVIPMNQKPIQWKLVKQCFHKITSTIETLIADINILSNPEKVDFGISFTGYSEDGDVGGTLTESSDEALRITSTTYIGNNIYLIGNIRNSFDGTKWNNDLDMDTFPNEYNEYVYDVSETLYAIYRSGDQFKAKSLYTTNSIDITFEDLYTRSLFHPFKTYSVETDKEGDKFSDNLLDMRFNKPKGEGTSYEITYLNLNLGSMYFDELIEQQGQYHYSNEENTYAQEFSRFVIQDPILNKFDLQNNFEQQLHKRAQYIRQNYTQVYEGLPQRVRELAVSVTEGCSTDYEKLVALESYLNTFTYTTSPKQPSKGTDLIDFLLFNTQEGYCTYYATAFAVMARCLDIPTRYVQGFCVVTNGQNNRFQYSAYNRDAHAWVEAYIEGIGWIPFEPTPTYKSLRYQPWLYSDNNGAPNATKPTKAPEYLEELLRQEEEIRNRQKAYRSIGLIVILVFLLILISIPVYFGLRYYHFKNRYKKSSIEGKVYSDIRQMLYMFECCIRKREISETFSAYMNSIRPQYPKQEIGLCTMESVFHRLRYNNFEPTETEQQAIANLKLELLKEEKILLSFSKYVKLRWQLFSRVIKNESKK